ncbi:MAG: hypothetical protein J1F35_04680 [Erysipelotrichales bacterium]|nr:hypothetical protein [Erysipelotrichales bacterium]
MKYTYKKIRKVKYNNKLFQIFIRDDNKLTFLKINNDNEELSYEYPTAQEFLHLNSLFNITNGIKF